ncbi:MAG: efflux RND transporter periplasmic adaptor subunit [Bacteroidales bacterium]|jgi:RND family efflux transporter MFP subunit|nr:efflux RND transporter periplasmic adaptor subunit [Bacteroidales bacterium]
MKTRNLLAVLLIISAGMIFTSCGSSDAKNKSTDSGINDANRVRPVKIMELSEEVVSRDVEYPANLTANEEVYLAPSTPGRIIRINAEIGDKVRAGQLLVQMDPTQLNTTELQLISLEKDMQRFDTLIQYGGVSQQQYDQMKTQVDVTRANYELLATNTNLSAPFSGTITGKYFENGELYSGSPNTQAGKAAIVVLQQTSPIKAIISVSEKYYPVVKAGMPVSLTTEIYPDQIFEGKISLVHPTINSATKTFNVEIQVPNASELLRPGMYAKVNLELGQESALVVPSTAVLQQLGTNIRYVFLYENGSAKKVIVKLGKRFDDKIEIISDQIKGNDKLIIAGHTNLDNGSKVEVTE